MAVWECSFFYSKRGSVFGFRLAFTLSEHSASQTIYYHLLASGRRYGVLTFVFNFSITLALPQHAIWEALSRVQYCNCFEFSDGINLTCDYFCPTFSWSILILFIHLCLWISEHIKDATLYLDAASI